MLLDGFETTHTNRLDVSDGGFINGPGSETSDDIFAALPLGGFIVNAAAVRVIGRERLEQLVALSQRARSNAKLSMSEFAIPPEAVVALGSQFWHDINQAGHPDGDAAHATNRANEMLALLVSLTDGDLERVPADVRRAMGLGEPSSANCQRQTAFAMGDLAYALGNMARGAVPVAMALDKEKEDKRRYDERMAMDRQTHAQLIAANGIKLKQVQQEQADDEALRQHLRSWFDGRQRIQAGDFTDFYNGLNEYNANGVPFDDGHTIKARPTGDGKSQVLDRYNAEGQLVETSPPLTRVEALRLYDIGMGEKLKWMSPQRWDAATKAAAAASEKAADRQTRLDVADRYAGSREYAADTRADAGQEIASIRAGATTEAARIRAEAPRSAGLTTAQERTNDSIAAARQQLSGMSQADVMRKTQSSMASGRANPEYDPQLARAVKLANTRMFGDDEEHDKFSADRAQQNADVTAKQTALQRASAAMAADPDMKGFRLGEQTGAGFKVYDADGKHVGFFGKRK